MTVGETWGATLDNAPLYSDPDRKELSMVFQFEFTELDKQAGKEKWDTKPLDYGDLKNVLAKWQKLDFNHSWNSLFWNNHDLPRIVSRFGNDQQYRERSAKMLALLLHGLRGTPYIYQGEEIGMTNCPVSAIDEVEDIEARRMYQERLAEGWKKEDLIKAINAQGRDNARTPMQWDASASAGFTSGRPWLAVNPNCQEINVKNALNDQDSIYYFYKKLIALRHQERILTDGSFELLDTADAVMAYHRENAEDKWLVVCNLTGEEQEVSLPDKVKEVLLANGPVPEDLSAAVLPAYAAFLCRVKK